VRDMQDRMSRGHAERFLRRHGYALPADNSAAHVWCVDQATRGDIEAQCVLSTLYFWGITGQRDPELARRWCEKAAATGCKDAQCALAGYLVSGIAGNKHPETGVEMFRELIGAGHLPAMVSLGLLMLRGEVGVVARDPRGAVDLLLGPAQAGDALSQCVVGAELIGSDDAPTRQAGVKWIERAAEGGQPMAHRFLATFYRNGDDPYPVDEERANLHDAIAQRLEDAEH
jgi:uncharacterized protein